MADSRNDPWSRFGGNMYAGGAGIGNALYNWFGHPRNPADAAGNYYDQIPGEMKPYYEPFINAGTGALPNVQNAYQEMFSDPNAIIARLGAGYKESPGFKFRLGQSESAINNAAAAGGMAGSPQHQQQAGQLATDMSSDDYYKYLQNVLGLFGGGVQGEQGLVNQGYNASSELAQNLAQYLMSRGNLAYAGQQNQNERNAGAWGGLFGGLADIGSAYNWMPRE